MLSARVLELVADLFELGDLGLELGVGALQLLELPFEVSGDAAAAVQPDVFKAPTALKEACARWAA